MADEIEYPDSLKKLIAANDTLHEAANAVLKDDAFIVYNKCAAAEQFRRAFGEINTAKSMLGWEPESVTPHLSGPVVEEAAPEKEVA